MNSKSPKPEWLDAKRKDVSSMLVHHLHNLLTSVQFFSDYMISDGEEDSEKKAVTQELFYSVKNASELCMNLYFSYCLEHPDDGLPESRHFETGELVRRVIQSYAIPAKKKHIEVVTAIDEIWIESDARMLQLILQNLVSNALRFTPHGGKIVVHSLSVKDELRITVRDTGQGIPAEKQERVFEPDITGSYGTDNEKGGGLGLYLCRQCCEQLGGRIWFSSSPEGSEFSVAIPLIPEGSGTDV